MKRAQHDLLRQLKDYIEAFLKHARSAEDSGVELRQLITALEDIQKHPELRVRVELLAASLRQRTLRLQARLDQPDAEPSVAGHVLASAFEHYIDDTIAYLDRAGDLRREQLALLIGDLVADLKLLALHQDIDQLRALSGGIDAKRAQLLSLQRPWQSASL